MTFVMRSGVLFVVFVIFIETCKSASTERPCTTSLGLSGLCIKEEECSTNDRSTLSKCGYDRDNYYLFCCEKNKFQVLTNFRGAIDESSEQKTVNQNVNSTPLRNQVSSTTAVPPSIDRVQVIKPPKQRNKLKGFAESNFVETSDHLTQNASRAYEPISSSMPTTSAGQTVDNNTQGYYNSCVTPNGEQAYCIPILSCSTFLQSIKISGSLQEDQKTFFRESRCGTGINGSILVCCGTDIKYKASYIAPAIAAFNQNNLVQGNCGIQFASRIFGGRNSDSYDFPWMALLEYEHSDGSRQFLCSGCLISPRYIITAAHCLSSNAPGANLINIRLGEWNLNSTNQGCTGTEDLEICNPLKVNVGIELIYPHPNYNRQNKSNDIGLLRLERNVEYNDMIRPICLPNINSYLYPGEKLTVSGWGLRDYGVYVSTKQKVELPVISTSECATLYQNRTHIGKGQFCAGGEAGKDTCAGDSGAPLMRFGSGEAGSRWSIEGIVSFGIGCGHIGRFGVYTKVSEYLEWIHNTIST